MAIDIPGDNPLAKPQDTITSSVEAVARFRTIQNADGSDIIDDEGLLTDNFQYGSVYLDQPADITSGTYTDISGTSQTFTLGRTTRVLFMINGQGNTTAGLCNIRMVITGLTQGNVVPELEFNTTAYPTASNIHRIFEVPAADPVTFKLQAKITASGTMQFGGGYITSSFLVLGTE